MCFFSTASTSMKPVKQMSLQPRVLKVVGRRTSTTLSVKNNDRVFVCDECEHLPVFGSQHGLWKHYKAKHTDSGSWLDGDCGKFCNSPSIVRASSSTPPPPPHAASVDDADSPTDTRPPPSSPQPSSVPEQSHHQQQPERVPSLTSCVASSQSSVSASSVAATAFVAPNSYPSHSIISVFSCPVAKPSKSECK